MISSEIMLILSIAIILFNVRRATKYKTTLNTIFNFSLLLLGYSTFILLAQLSFKYKFQTLNLLAPGFGFILALVILLFIILPFKSQIKVKKITKIKFFTYLSLISLILGLISKFYILINFALILSSYLIFWLIVDKLTQKKLKQTEKSLKKRVNK